MQKVELLTLCSRKNKLLRLGGVRQGYNGCNEQPLGWALECTPNVIIVNIYAIRQCAAWWASTLTTHKHSPGSKIKQGKKKNRRKTRKERIPTFTKITSLLYLLSAYRQSTPTCCPCSTLPFCCRSTALLPVHAWCTLTTLRGDVLRGTIHV